jgi:hypothetical protein
MLNLFQNIKLWLLIINLKQFKNFKNCQNYVNIIKNIIRPEFGANLSIRLKYKTKLLILSKAKKSSLCSKILKKK